MAFWRGAGGVLFEWQESAIEEILGLDEAGQWVSTADGLDVARQNGKGVILQAIEAFFAFELDYPVVLHTAHEFATSQEHQLRLEAMIQNCPHLDRLVRGRGGYMHANGRESINLKSGCRILFKARTKGGGRGYSGDLLVWDEAMVIPDAVVGAQMPTTRASRTVHGRKTIYAGSAVDQEVHEHGLNFARLRDRGIAKEDRVSWQEWSAPIDDLAEVTAEVLRDRSLWRLANPSMEEGLVSEETMADEVEAMPPRTAAVELLGIGDWPQPGAAAGVIDFDEWVALTDDTSSLLDPVCFAVDAAPDRSRASISAAGFRADELVHVEVVETRPGTGWVVKTLADLHRKHNPLAIVVDGRGPAGSLLHELKEANVPVEKVGANEYANACGLFFDLIDQERIRHLGQPELNVAVRAGQKRDLGDAWAWSRKRSSTDISTLVAATLALWGVSTRTQTVYTGRGVVIV